MTLHSIGRWFALKYQAQAHERGYQHAARNLRKQGVPIDVARAILFGDGRRNVGVGTLVGYASGTYAMFGYASGIDRFATQENPR